MTYQAAVEYIDHHISELEYDKQDKMEYIVFIAPTNPKHYEEFNRLFVLNNYNPNVILPYVNEDVCVMRVAKKYLASGVFLYKIIAE